MEKSVEVDALLLGTCYYPEQWSESLWEDDYRRMRDMGLSVIRVGEFAWSIFEPSEGEFSFELFDRALDLAHQYGLQVVFGTPTATPPAWLTTKYPEALNVSIEGVQYKHGQRRHYTYNSPVYRELSARIVRNLAQHYAAHPSIIGWQIDNEINCETNVFYSDADHAAFRGWLKERYGTLQALNASWGAVFWNQTYSSWEQVHLARPTVSHSPNPHQLLDEKRFISASARSYVKMQSDILREIVPAHWVTTNGLFGHLDSHEMTKESLDFFSYDSYPNFSTIFPDAEPAPLLDRKWGFNLSIARSISPQFWVMEQQAGPGGWVNKMVSPSPKPGQLRLWTYQSIAHGADAVTYFRWRTATVGTEIYWHGINDYHNRPNRRIAEVSRVGEEFAAIGNKLKGTVFEAEVALLRDYDNEWDGEFDKWLGPLIQKSELAWYKSLQHQHVPLDIFYMRTETVLSDLSRYKVLVYPHAAILSDDTVEILTAYVEQGGQLILGCRTGLKNTSGHCTTRPLPGLVAELCGVEVDDFTWIATGAAASTLEWTAKLHKTSLSSEFSTEGDSIQASDKLFSSEATLVTADGFNDILKVIKQDASVLAYYADDYYAGSPALVSRKHGEGRAYYYGAVFNTDLIDSLLPQLNVQSPIYGKIDVPAEVEVCIRRRSDGVDQYFFLLNYSHSEQVVVFHEPMFDLLTSQTKRGQMSMLPFQVMILTLKGA